MSEKKEVEALYPELKELADRVESARVYYYYQNMQLEHVKDELRQHLDKVESRIKFNELARDDLGFLLQHVRSDNDIWKKREIKDMLNWQVVVKEE